MPVITSSVSSVVSFIIQVSLSSQSRSGRHPKNTESGDGDSPGTVFGVAYGYKATSEELSLLQPRYSLLFKTVFSCGMIPLITYVRPHWQMKSSMTGISPAQAKLLTCCMTTDPPADCGMEASGSSRWFVSPTGIGRLFYALYVYPSLWIFETYRVRNSIAPWNQSHQHRQYVRECAPAPDPVECWLYYCPSYQDYTTSQWKGHHPMVSKLPAKLSGERAVKLPADRNEPGRPREVSHQLLSAGGSGSSTRGLGGRSSSD